MSYIVHTIYLHIFYVSALHPAWLIVIIIIVRLVIGAAEVKNVSHKISLLHKTASTVFYELIKCIMFTICSMYSVIHVTTTWLCTLETLLTDFSIQ